MGLPGSKAAAGVMARQTSGAVGLCFVESAGMVGSLVQVVEKRGAGVTRGKYGKVHCTRLQFKHRAHSHENHEVSSTYQQKSDSQ